MLPAAHALSKDSIWTATRAAVAPRGSQAASAARRSGPSARGSRLACSGTFLESDPAQNSWALLAPRGTTFRSEGPGDEAGHGHGASERVSPPPDAGDGRRDAG